jgi:hypothetical protein
MLKKKVTATFILSMFFLSMASEKCTEGLAFNGFTGRFTCDLERIPAKEVSSMLQEVPEAHELFLKGRTLNLVGMIPATIGAAALGWGLGIKMSEETPLTPSGDPALIIGGIGLSIGMPFVFAANGKKKRAVAIYNEKIKEIALPSLKISANSVAAVWDF